MKVLTAHSGRAVALTRLRKRLFVWPGSSGLTRVPVTKTTLAALTVPATLDAVGVAGHGLLEMGAGDFVYNSQDKYLNLTNSAAVTALVVTKGAGAGTIVTESQAALVGLVSVEIMT